MQLKVLKEAFNSGIFNLVENTIIDSSDDILNIFDKKDDEPELLYVTVPALNYTFQIWYELDDDEKTVLQIVTFANENFQEADYGEPKINIHYEDTEDYNIETIIEETVKIINFYIKPRLILEKALDNIVKSIKSQEDFLFESMNDEREGLFFAKYDIATNLEGIIEDKIRDLFNGFKK